jgi:hypothetical protein
VHHEPLPDERVVRVRRLVRDDAPEGLTAMRRDALQECIGRTPCLPRLGGRLR